MRVPGKGPGRVRRLLEDERRRAMPNVGSLVREGGVLIKSLRHGPEPPDAISRHHAPDRYRAHRSNPQARRLLLNLMAVFRLI